MPSWVLWPSSAWPPWVSTSPSWAATGVGPDGISTSNAEEGRLQNVVLERSERRVAVCDGSKLGRRDFYTFFPVEGLDAVVCPGPADPDRLAALGERTQVIR